MKQPETTTYHYDEVIWTRPQAQQLPELLKHIEPWRVYPKYADDMVPGDCTATFKTARVDIVWQKPAESNEWLWMVKLMQTGVRLKLIVGVSNRVRPRLVTGSLHPLEYTFDGQYFDNLDTNEPDSKDETARVQGGVMVPHRQSFELEVGLSDELRALIAERADIVRVYLDGEKTRDLA